MAENELLDVANGKRWGETRRDLRSGLDPAAIAARAVGELNRGIRRSLVSAYQKPERDTLQSVIQGTHLGPAATQATILRFPDRTLARIIVGAYQKLPGCKEPRHLVDKVTSLVSDQVRDAIIRLAGETIRYQATAERQALAAALAEGLANFRPQLHSLIADSVAGRPVKLAQRPRANQASKQLRVRTVLEQSLLPAAIVHSHAERRH